MSTVANLIVKTKGYRLQRDADNWIIIDKLGKRGLCIAVRDLQYIQEVTDNFDFLFESVTSVDQSGLQLVDFSQTAYHELKGWPHFKVLFPSFAEPTNTTDQYIEFLQLEAGESLIDLGAYAGVSSMQFQEVVGERGRVVALEADPLNYRCTQTNFKSYQDMRGYSPSLIHAAGWSNSGTIKFSAEGNVGSAVVEISKRDRDEIDVKSMTLSEISGAMTLDDVKAIKADIEGAESEVFKDGVFFESHHPRIIFEAILKGSRAVRYRSAMKLLEEYGYKCEVITQHGSRQVLVGAR